MDAQSPGRLLCKRIYSPGTTNDHELRFISDHVLTNEVASVGIGEIA